MEISFDPKKITRFFVFIATCLILIHIPLQIYRVSTEGGDTLFGLGFLFDLDHEQSFPAFYSSVALLFSSILLGIVYLAKLKTKATFSNHWLSMATIFLFLSLDEALLFHERLTPPFKEFLHASGFLYSTWIVPYAILVIAFVSVFLEFIFHLPKKTRREFVIAGLVFVMGAIGFESISAIRYDALQTTIDPFYILLSTIEEALEMAGVILFIHALTSYIHSELPDLRIIFSSAKPKNLD